MFEIVTKGFKEAALKMKGQTRMTEESIAEALALVKRSLLDADVDLEVTKRFIEDVKQSVLSDVVTLKLKSGQKVSPGDYFIKACYDQLVLLLGGQTAKIIKNAKSGPTVILLAGLQGAGKTTHAAKIAHYLARTEAMKPLLVAADVYRPAAREQLRTLGSNLGIPVFSLEVSDAVQIAQQGVAYATANQLDVVIIDTAGRLAIDNALMTELEDIKAAVSPQNILLVIDAMIGQDAVRTAGVFDQRLHLTGVVLTKLDGDTRGGVALSVKKVTGKNIVFVGTGEHADKLEDFRPEGMASRILGMGDVVGLMQDFEKAIDEQQAAQSASRMQEGHFDFNDFLGMLSTLGRMGPVKDLIDKTPFAQQMEGAEESISDKDVVRKKAIVQSMTNYERAHPDVLTSHKSPSSRSRIARIAKGSSHTERDIKQFLEQFQQMKSMTQLMSGAFSLQNGAGKMPGMGQLKQMAKMAKMMGGQGQNPLAGMFGGAMPEQNAAGGFGIADLAEINRLKKKKKQEKLMKQKR